MKIAAAAATVLILAGALASPVLAQQRGAEHRAYQTREFAPTKVTGEPTEYHPLAIIVGVAY